MSTTVPATEAVWPPIHTQCFLDKDRLCSCACRAFVTRDSSCKILNTLDAVRTLWPTRAEVPKV